MELIRRFPVDVIVSALEAWAWLPDLQGKSVIATTAFGDPFLQGEDGVWFLDTTSGTLTREWDDAPSLQQALNTPDGQDQFLVARLVAAAHAAGLEPGPLEVLDFKVLPALGGALEVENLQVTDVSVALHVSGQMHEVIKDVPDGTQVRFTITD